MKYVVQMEKWVEVIVVADNRADLEKALGQLTEEQIDKMAADSRWEYSVGHSVGAAPATMQVVDNTLKEMP